MSHRLMVNLFGKIDVVHFLTFYSAIRQAISKSLVAYYQKCEFIL